MIIKEINRLKRKEKICIGKVIMSIRDRHQEKQTKQTNERTNRKKKCKIVRSDM